MSKTRTELAAIWPPTAAAAREAGHDQQSPLRAIRAKCLDCSCYQPSEVRLCEATGCALWPFRAGKHPWFAARERFSVEPADHEKPCQSDGDFEREEPFHDEEGTAP